MVEINFTIVTSVSLNPTYVRWIKEMRVSDDFNFSRFVRKKLDQEMKKNAKAKNRER